jgi:hypothetical protein
MNNMNNKEAVEYFLSDEDFENALINQSFIKKISGEDELDYDIDFTTAVDTDMDRNPYNKQQILLEINAVKKSTINALENESDVLTSNIKDWAKELDLDIYFDGIYTNEDNQVTVIFDIPADDDSWNYKKFIKKQGTEKKLDDIETIADEHWESYKGKASYDDFLKIFKIGYKSNKNDSKAEKKSKAEDGIVVETITDPMMLEVDAELKEKYGVTIQDIGVNEDWWEKIKDKNYSTQQIVEMLTKDYSLTPISPQKENSKKTDDESEESMYICLVKDSQGNVLSKYKLAYNDETYAKMFLDAIGIRLRNGDRIEIE